MNEEKKISLFMTEGRANKEYHAQLEQSGDGWVVNFQYGRRGSSMSAGTKTAQAVSYEKADKIYMKLVAEKTGKGYTEDTSGESYKGTENAGRKTGMEPMLSNPFDSSFSAADAIASAEWFGQEKFDGERQMIRAKGAEITLANRKGMSLPIPEGLLNAAIALSQAGGDYILDCERVGDALIAFDCLQWKGQPLEKSAAGVRVKALDLPVVCAKDGLPAGAKGFFMAELATTRESKQAMMLTLRQRGAEGMIFKLSNATYVSGRPASLGASLKEKFVETASVRVAVERREDKRSVGMESVDLNGNWVNLGNVTIPESKSIPQAGQIIEVKYLYAFPGGSLFQPVYLGVRTDLEESDLSVKSLKIKESERAA